MQGRIREVRKQNGLTQPAFGCRIGLSKDAIANLEYGRVEPSEIVLRSICREFGVSYVWLKDGTEAPYKSDEDRITAKVVTLLAGEGHKKTKALIRALARLEDHQLDAIDKYVDYLLEELGD